MGNQVPALSLFDILFLLRTVLTTPPRPKKIELRENNVFLLWGLFVVASSCGINPIRVEYVVSTTHTRTYCWLITSQFSLIIKYDDLLAMFDVFAT